MRNKLFLILVIVSVVGMVVTNKAFSQSLGKSPSGKVEVVLGYLYVYPEDLGSFNGEPKSVIKAVNNQNLYGYDNWRLPTSEELSLLETAKDKLGISSIYGYMTMQNSNSEGTKKVRLVRDSSDPYVLSTGAIVAKFDEPGTYTWIEAKRKCANKGDGWYLPTKAELNEMYQKKFQLGGFTDDWHYDDCYWSSSEYNSYDAWEQYFSDGKQYHYPDNKYKGRRIRCVRKY